jgi:hypothetical protein
LSSRASIDTSALGSLIARSITELRRAVSSGVFKKPLDVGRAPTNSPLAEPNRARECPFLHPLIDSRALQANFDFDLCAA